MDNRIENLLKHFNFEKVHKAMVAVNWEWAFPENHIPSVIELNNCAEYLLKELYKQPENGGYIRTGGFKASWKTREDGSKYMCLEFIFAGCDDKYST